MSYANASDAKSADRPQSQISAMTIGIHEDSLIIERKLRQLLGRLRPEPPKEVGPGGISAIESLPPITTVLERTVSTQRNCIDLLNEIEAFA